MTAPQFDTDWVKLPRSVVDALSGRGIALGVYVLCLERARYSGSPVRDGLAPGQCYIGQVEVAKKLGFTRDQIRTAIEHLVRTEIITISTTRGIPGGIPNRGTTVTILGYEGINRTADGESPQESPAAPPSVIPNNKNQISDRLGREQIPAAQPPGDHQRDHYQRDPREDEPRFDPSAEQRALRLEVRGIPPEHCDELAHRCTNATLDVLVSRLMPNGVTCDEQRLREVLTRRR